jgi:phage baseplate assembly protein W
MSFDLKLQNGDLQISNTNDIAKVEGSDKLKQDIIKIISTPIGSNPLFPWYGSPINQSLIGTAFSSNFISNLASVQLKASLENLQNIQKEQAKGNQIVTPQEQIAAVQDVIIQRNTEDPRFFKIMLTVLSKAFRQVQTSLNIQI